MSDLYGGVYGFKKGCQSGSNLVIAGAQCG